MNKSATRSLILIISLLAMLALTWPVQAQTPTLREALEQTIQAAQSRATGNLAYPGPGQEAGLV